MNNKNVEDAQKECKPQAYEKAIDSENDNSLINIFIDFIKDELLKSNIRYEIVKPILVYILYYLIPFVMLLMFLNFITTIIAVYIVFKYLL
jgi:flagellar biosynthesis protein FlhB